MLKPGIVAELEYMTGLLELDRERETVVVLDRALRLVVTRACARYGYIEVEAEPRTGEERRLWRAHDCSEPHVVSVQARVSRRIILSALRSGTTVRTASAIDDPRFAAAGSVRQYEIGAVLCVPFGKRHQGVIYLQSPVGGGAFGPDVPPAIELAAQRLTSLFEPYRLEIGPTLSARERADVERQERVVEALAQHGRNLSAIERETGISRKQLRKMLRDRNDEP